MIFYKGSCATWKDKMTEYVGCCVNLSGDSITDMVDDSKEINYDEFIYHVDEKELEEMFEYYDWDDGNDLKLKDDWAVRYFKSKYEGHNCWYIDHSSIEYVWIS